MPKGPCLSSLRPGAPFPKPLGSEGQTRVQIPESSPLPSSWPRRLPWPHAPPCSPRSSFSRHFLILTRSPVRPASEPLPVFCPPPGVPRWPSLGSGSLPVWGDSDVPHRADCCELGPVSRDGLVVTVSNVRPASAGFLFWPHPDPQLCHVPVDSQMTPWLGFPGSRVLEGLVAAWGHTGRQGSTPGPPDPVRKAQPQTHGAPYPHRPAEPAPPRRHPGDTGPPESIRQVPVRRGREQSSAGGRLSGPAPSQVLTSCVPDFVLFEILLTLGSLTPSFRKSPWMASASACHPLGGDDGRNR